MNVENPDPAQRLMVLDIWSDIRPYVQCIVADFLVCALIWVSLWGLLQLETLLKVPGWPAQWMPNVHGFGAVLLAATFVGFLVHDVYQIRMGRRK